MTCSRIFQRRQKQSFRHRKRRFRSRKCVFDIENIVFNIENVVFDAGNVKLYLNGILDGSGIMNTTSLSHVQNVPIYLGSVNGNNSFWNGHLDDISIWNTSLTQSEIQTYMSCPPTGNEAGLIGYWNFNEGTGGTRTGLAYSPGRKTEHFIFLRCRGFPRVAERLCKG